MSKVMKRMVSTASLLFLAGCTNYSISSVSDTTVTLQEDTDELVENFNQLYDQEADLLATFESDLESDPELETFASNDASVFENIESRQSHLDQIAELNSNLKDHADYFSNYDGDELDTEETQALSENLSSLAQEISEFTEQYQDSLDNQSSYFNSLGEADASADTLIDGISEIVEEHESLVELSHSLNESFDQTLQLIEDFNQSLEAASEEVDE